MRKGKSISKFARGFACLVGMLSIAASLGGCGNELTTSLIMEPGSVAQVQATGDPPRVTLINEGPASLGVQTPHELVISTLEAGEKYSYQPKDGRAVVLHNGEEQRTVLAISIKKWNGALVTQDGNIMLRSIGAK